MCMQNYGEQLRYLISRNSEKIINILYNQENLAKPLSEFVGMVTQRQDNQMANTIIRELTQQLKNNECTLESGIRNVAKFLQKLSKQAPKSMYYNISELLGFFDLDAYVLRQSLIKIICNIILYVLRSDQDDLDDNQKKIYF